MTDLYSQAQSAADFIRSKTPLQPTLGIILGSGLGNFASQVQDATTIPYAGIPVAVMQGRVHAYEGYSMAQVTFPTRVLGLLGVRQLIVTNAAGGINTRYGQG